MFELLIYDFFPNHKSKKNPKHNRSGLINLYKQYLLILF